MELFRYVVLNPVRVKLVDKPEEWPWSSYHATHRAPEWLSVAEVLSLVNGSEREVPRVYRQFVREGINQSSPWSQVRGQIFLGSEDFRERMERLLRGQRLANVPVVKTQRLTPEEVLARAGKVYGVGVKEMISRSYGKAYRCAAWLLRRAANEPLQAVARRFAVSASRISHIQRALDWRSLSGNQRKATKLCKVKQ